MECKRERNLEICTCTYSTCSNTGICCDCLIKHLKSRQLPGCCFSKEGEATYDRSFEHFARLVNSNQI